MDDVQFWNWRSDDYQALLKQNREWYAQAMAAMQIPPELLTEPEKPADAAPTEGGDGPSVA
jgi:hypothetical protein